MDKQRILIAFYGDDFTGTMATAEALTQSGTPTVTFTTPPSPDFLKSHFPQVKAVGIAGTARTIAADKLQDVLTPVFQIMKEYQSPIYLYKVCSTFDSSEHIGSIGKAIELGIRTFSPDFVPVLPAAPKFKRYTVFGHHFAALGEGEIFRLDRNPSIANHPITPMNESDLRLHLARQTALKSGLINILDIDKGEDHIRGRIDRLISEETPIIFFDCLYDKHLNTVCNTVFQRCDMNRPVLFFGAQDLGYSLSNMLMKAGLLTDEGKMNEFGKKSKDKGPILVLSGSCATVTGEQILRAKQQGFFDLKILPQDLLVQERKDAEKATIIQNTLNALEEGKSVILHTAIGPNDERIHAMKAKTEELSLYDGEANENLGHVLGEITRTIIHSSSVKRVIIVGGDTSGRIQRYLDIEALQVSQSVGEVPAPLCYVYSQVPEINGLEVAFKGGQVGAIDYFHMARSIKTCDFAEAALGRL